MHNILVLKHSRDRNTETQVNKTKCFRSEKYCLEYNFNQVLNGNFKGLYNKLTYLETKVSTTTKTVVIT